MSEQEIVVSGITYVPSKVAAEKTTYAQDYIGQLARTGQIDARRIGGLWYVSLDSLYSYKKVADSYTPQPPREKAKNPQNLLSFDGKDYISAASAADLTGYHQDYIGQLAREGAILARQVGSRWYVERQGILEHKKHKDSLLAAVQAESVGLRRADTGVPRYSDPEPFFIYKRDSNPLLPLEGRGEISQEVSPERTLDLAPASIPIRIVEQEVRSEPISYLETTSLRTHEKTSKSLVILGALATVVIFLSFGFTTLKINSVYASGNRASDVAAAVTTGAGQALSWLGDTIEHLLAPEIIYRRAP